MPPFKTSFIVLFEKRGKKSEMNFNLIHVIHFLTKQLFSLSWLNEGFSSAFNLFYPWLLYCVSFMLIHAVHIYLNGLFILLPLVQLLNFLNISSIIISPLILLQWMWNFHMTSTYCYILVLCNKRRRWFDTVFI